MYMTVDGYNINYKTTGDGDKTLVVLQGWGTAMELYDSVAEILGHKYRVVQFDMPGFGASDEPEDSWSVGQYADFVLKFFDSLDIKKTSLLGHSYGGRVIIELAARNSLPVEIEKIILMDSAGVMPERTPAQQRSIKKYKMLKALANTKLAQMMCPELIEEWQRNQGSADYKNASPVMRSTLVKAVNYDQTHLLPKIDEETLLIWGDMDDATPISDAYTMERLIPNNGLAVIKGAGHYSFLEQPETFRHILESFLLQNQESAEEYEL